VCPITVLPCVRSGPTRPRRRPGKESTHGHAGRPRRARHRGRHPQATHTAAVVAAATGAVLEQATVPATPAGYRQLLALADRQRGRRVWAIESTGGYGAGLTRFLAAHAEQVVELDRPKPTARRHGAKSDPLAATRQPANPGPRPARPAPCRRPAGSPVGAASRPALGGPGRTDAQRQLHAHVVTAPDTLRSRSPNLTTARLVATCGRLRYGASTHASLAAATVARSSSPMRRRLPYRRPWRPARRIAAASGVSNPCSDLGDGDTRLRQSSPEPTWPDQRLPERPVLSPRSWY
jgi:hypothetical protein